MAAAVNKIHLYFKNIYLDYYEVFKDIGKSARAKPGKASFYGFSTIFILNLFRTNEGLRSYDGEVISACNRIAAVTENSRNPDSFKFVQSLGELNCQRVLRQVDLGFSTLIYKSECGKNNALYRYNCSYLNPSIKEFVQERVVDFGLMGHWLILENKMRDYDVNDREYDNFVASEKIKQIQ